MGFLKEIKDIGDADFWGDPIYRPKSESANYFLLLGTTAFYSALYFIPHNSLFFYIKKKKTKKKTADKSKFSTETGVRYLWISKAFSMYHKIDVECFMFSQVFNF